MKEHARLFFCAITVAFGATMTAFSVAPDDFTYQGRQMDGGLPVTGLHDFDVSCFDADLGGAMLGAHLQSEH